MKISTETRSVLLRLTECCTDCGLCQEECVFLREAGLEPREFAERLLAGTGSEELSIVYSCNLCGACKEVCPEKFDLGKVFALLRGEMIEQEKELPPSLEWLRERQDWINRGGFIYAGCEDWQGKCESAFFPGCMLSGYSPQLVLETYSYLKQHYDESAGIILNCCGAPFRDLGARKDLSETVHTVGLQLQKLRAEKLVVACPNCYRIFREHFPQYQVLTVYEIMEKGGLPARKRGLGEQVYLFHSCATRDERGVQQAVQAVIEAMGFRIRADQGAESQIRCCGTGGMVGLTNPVMATIIGAERTEGIDCDIVTYCAACREALVNYHPSIHVLDLVFNPDWKTDKENPSREDHQMRENFQRLKRQLQERFVEGQT